MTSQARFNTLDDINASGKRTLVRVDLNVPFRDGKISDDTRIRAVAPTITELADAGAKVVLLAHFGRPKGKAVPEMSLQEVASATAEVLKRPVTFANDDHKRSEYVADMSNGDILMLENIRFHAGEETNDPEFASEIASLGDLYVNDAFSASHRAHTSTEGLARLLPAYAGRTMEAELKALGAALETPKRPLVAVVGGAKVSTKLELLSNLSKLADTILIGGGMANTFLASQGIDIGKSLCEHDLKQTAADILANADANNCNIVLPVDGVVATDFAANAENRVSDFTDITDEEMILDIGPKSIEAANAVFDQAATIVWNGPFGAFEMTPFDTGTVETARHAGKLSKDGSVVSVAGGGDTVSALKHAGAAKDFTYISTAGGAFLEWLEGKPLPGVKALEDSKVRKDK